MFQKTIIWACKYTIYNASFIECFFNMNSINNIIISFLLAVVLLAFYFSVCMISFDNDNTRQHFLVRQIFLRFRARGLSVCGTSDLKTHCRLHPVLSLCTLMNIFIPAQTFALLPFPLSLSHMHTKGGGGVWGAVMPMNCMMG